MSGQLKEHGPVLNIVRAHFDISIDRSKITETIFHKTYSPITVCFKRQVF